MTGIRSLSRPPTPVCWVIDSPKSSVSAPETKSRYWLGSDWSRPSCSFSVATALGVARAPSTIRAGSPGTRWIRKNDARVIPIRTGIACSTRRNKYAPTCYCDSHTWRSGHQPIGKVWKLCTLFRTPVIVLVKNSGTAGASSSAIFWISEKSLARCSSLSVPEASASSWLTFGLL